MQTLIEPTEQVNQTNWQNEDDYDSTKIRICMIIIDMYSPHVYPKKEIERGEGNVVGCIHENFTTFPPPLTVFPGWS